MHYWQQRVRDLPVGGKLFLFCTALLGVFLILAVGLVSVAGYRFAAQRGATNLVVGQRVLVQVLAQKQETLQLAARVLAADSGFRAALATGDADAIASVLQGQESRIKADLAVALDPGGRVISGTVPAEPARSQALFSSLAQRAMREGEAGGVATVGDRPLQLIMVPVKAARTIGWVVLGYTLDDVSLSRVADLVSLDVSLLAQSGGSWHLQASSLRQRAGLAETLAGHAAGSDATAALLTVDGQTYQFSSLALHTVDGSHLVAVLQQPFAEAVAPYQRLLLLLIGLLVISFLIAMAGSRRLARLLSRPLVQLTQKAQAIARGQYGQPLTVVGRDEIGLLAESVNAMSDAIAAREREITQQAYYDPLTQLPNRQMMTMLGEQAIALAQRERRALAVITMDIERFHAVNDALGYAVGDKLIRSVGHRLRDVMREADAISRPGGNQFIALMHTPTELNLSDLHRRLDEAFGLPFEIDGNPVDVALSTGVALYPEHGGSMQELMRNSDIALSVAKHDRLGIVRYSASLEQSRLEHLTLLSDLKRAVELNELVMYLQPKVNVLTGLVTSAEALVRWQHPERGFIPPSEFVPFAEQSGRIGMLTRWMLGRAMELTRQWAESGRPLQVSVNVSARDVLDERFPATLETLMRHHQAQPQWIRLEITESGVMENAERALDVLGRVRGLGFSLSIDDFGTGYSSLSYLKRMPVAELKIDRSFVQGARSGSDAAVLLRSTIDLGHNLGLSVVAEGVETPEEWALLRELGCDYIQGYLASRPLDVEAFLEWCRRVVPFHPVLPDPA